MNKSIIIDASVVAKWLLPDGEDPLANLIKRDFTKRIITISVPTLIFYEINNLLKSAILSNRLNIKQAVNLYEVFLNLDFIVYWSKQLLISALKRALELNISSYDAAYVVLSGQFKSPFMLQMKNWLKKLPVN
ncbi:type II toxin-antitoxin system VapC family toxin [Candidatus Daviesbacteria bacterium]|nr:type II toxin-antitoxin system VapC family toxin [Candidatus Daviesbacteria bacterium]